MILNENIVNSIRGKYSVDDHLFYNETLKSCENFASAIN